MEIADMISRTSDFHGAHVGCVVALKKNILSVASNSEKTHTLQQMYNKYRNFNLTSNKTVHDKLHAEVCALSLIRHNKGINWKDVEVYVYRSWRNGRPAISKPCPACMQLIKDMGIKTIVYNDEAGNTIKEMLL